MKKTLYLSAITAILSVMIITGCGEDGLGDQYILEEHTVSSISAPGNLTAVSKPGANLISWGVVKDATSYKVYRTDTVTGETAIVGSSPSTLYYLDKAGFNNPLVDKRKYTYTVVASAGTGAKLREGKASADVTAAIPARGDAAVLADAIQGLDVKQITGADGFGYPVTNTEALEVTWSKPDFIEPQYAVFYSYGDNAQTAHYSSEVSSVGLGAQLVRQEFPLTGGKITVKVTAKWDNEDYYKSAEATTVIDASPTVLASVGGFDVETAETGIYELAWNAVEGATGYDIWKAEGTIDDSTIGGTTGAWQRVPGTPIQKSTGGQYKLTESGVDTSKRYTYGIVATNGAARSGSLATVTADPVTSSISIASFNITETEAANGSRQLSITATASDGETFALSRAEAVFETASSSYPKSIGAYTPVGSPSPVGNYYTWIDAPAIRASYAYKLTVTKGGLTREIVQYAKNGSYTPFIPLSLSAQAAPANVYSITLTNYTYPALAYDQDLRADVYQAETEGQYNYSPRTPWTKITSTPVSYGTLSSDGFIAGNLTSGTYYIYRVELISTGGKTVYASGGASSPVQPSVASPSSFGWTGVTGTNAHAKFTDGYETGDNDARKLLRGTRVFVGVYDAATGGYVSTGVSAVIAKAPEAGVTDPLIAGYYYYVQFSTSQLNGLNSGSLAKQYILVTESNDGSFTQFGNSFSVANGAVSGWL